MENLSGEFVGGENYIEATGSKFISSAARNDRPTSILGIPARHFLQPPSPTVNSSTEIDDKEKRDVPD